MSKLDNFCANQQNVHGHLKCKKKKKKIENLPHKGIYVRPDILWVAGWLLFEMLLYTENIFHCP